MSDYYKFLKYLLLFVEVTAAVVGIFKFNKFKNSYWKWFIYYLVFIACSELLCKFVIRYHDVFLSHYYAFFIIPLEFLTFYWLYAHKSLNQKKLFWISFVAFLLSLIPYFVYDENQSVNSFNYCVGAFFMSIMIILEYRKQMKSDDILRFGENMMFYVNIGAGFFYVGTLPFYAFYNLLLQDTVILNNYYLFFLITNILMYSLFSIAFIWGKPNTY